MNGMQYTRSHMLVAIGPFRGTEMRGKHREPIIHFKAEYASFLRYFFQFFPSRKCYARIMPGSSIKAMIRVAHLSCDPPPFPLPLFSSQPSFFILWALRQLAWPRWCSFFLVHKSGWWVSGRPRKGPKRTGIRFAGPARKMLQKMRSFRMIFCHLRTVNLASVIVQIKLKSRG